MHHLSFSFLSVFFFPGKKKNNIVPVHDRKPNKGNFKPSKYWSALSIRIITLILLETSRSIIFIGDINCPTAPNTHGGELAKKNKKKTEPTAWNPTLYLNLNERLVIFKHKLTARGFSLGISRTRLFTCTRGCAKVLLVEPMSCRH